MTTQINHISLHPKPSKVRFPIPLKAGELKRLMKYFQAKVKPTLYFLHKNIQTNKYYFTNSKKQFVRIVELPSVCAFVILENEKGHLELILGEGHHAYIAGGATESCAAGDVYFNTKTIQQLPPETIYFDLQQIVERITDQSGSYHIPLTDPLLQEKRISAIAAMEACDLPIHKLEYFTEPDLMSLCNLTTQAAIRKISEVFQTNDDLLQQAELLQAAQKALLFSDGPNRDISFKISEYPLPENASVLLNQQLMETESENGTAPAA